MSDAPSVPCGSCSLCCYGQIPLRPLEKTVLAFAWVMHEGMRIRVLPRKPDGECAYLVAGRCSVYEDRPQICRGFDCRDHYFKPAAERRRIEAALMTPRDRAIIRRGRDLVEQAR